MLGGGVFSGMVAMSVIKLGKKIPSISPGILNSKEVNWASHYLQEEKKVWRLQLSYIHQQ